MYIHMHTHTYTHMDTHRASFRWRESKSTYYVQTCRPTHVHTCTYMTTHVHTCTYMTTHVHTCTYMTTHVHACTYMTTHVHTCTYMTAFHNFRNSEGTLTEPPFHARTHIWIQLWNGKHTHRASFRWRESKSTYYVQTCRPTHEHTYTHAT